MDGVFYFRSQNNPLFVTFQPVQLTLCLYLYVYLYVFIFFVLVMSTDVSHTDQGIKLKKIIILKYYSQTNGEWLGKWWERLIHSFTRKRDTRDVIRRVQQPGESGYKLFLAWMELVSAVHTFLQPP